MADTSSLVDSAYEKLGYDSSNVSSARKNYWSGKLKSGKVSKDNFESTFLDAAANGPQGSAVSDADYKKNKRAVKRIKAGKPVNQPEPEPEQQDTSKLEEQLNNLRSEVRSSNRAAQNAARQAAGSTSNAGTSSNSAPAQTEVTPEQTLSGQLSELLKSDSSLMDRVGTRASQAANNRGLLNSSMAQSAAQGALVDQGTKIAGQDAQTNFQNTQSNAGREQQDYLQRLSFDQDLQRAEQQYQIDSSLIQEEGDKALERLYGTSMANAWGVMGNNITDIVGQSMRQIQTIQNNPNIEAEAKTKMIEDIMESRDQDVQFQAELYSTLPDTLQDTGIFPETVG